MDGNIINSGGPTSVDGNKSPETTPRKPRSRNNNPRRRRPPAKDSTSSDNSDVKVEKTVATATPAKAKNEQEVKVAKDSTSSDNSDVKVEKMVATATPAKITTDASE